jgi:hypothetical protein
MPREVRGIHWPATVLNDSSSMFSGTGSPPQASFILVTRKHKLRLLIANTRHTSELKEHYVGSCGMLR